MTGIYKITCIVSGRVYVGSAVNVPARWSKHRELLARGTHRNAILQQSWNKHGKDTFEFALLETALPAALLEREAFWMQTLNAHYRHGGFNINPTPHSRLGRPHTAESKAKMSANRKGKPRLELRGKPRSAETKAKMSKALKGRIVSPVHRTKISAALRGKIIPADVRAKMSLANKGRPKPEGFGFRIAAKQAFFTREEIGQVRTLAAGGVSRRQIGRLFGTSHVVVSKVLDGKGSYYSAV